MVLWPNSVHLSVASRWLIQERKKGIFYTREIYSSFTPRDMNALDMSDYNQFYFCVVYLALKCYMKTFFY